ncbi:hypothetical protein HDE_11501 [Halotydeus destructor]|nr:hypothetical protein HDE_11501 [Halotydeus destructor]
MALFQEFDDKIITCPFNSVHRLATRSFQVHITNCPSNPKNGGIVHHSFKSKERCMFNSSHFVLAGKLEEHHSKCPDNRVLVKSFVKVEETRDPLVLSVSETMNSSPETKEEWHSEGKSRFVLKPLVSNTLELMETIKDPNKWIDPMAYQRLKKSLRRAAVSERLIAVKGAHVINVINNGGISVPGPDEVPPPETEDSNWNPPNGSVSSSGSDSVFFNNSDSVNEVWSMPSSGSACSNSSSSGSLERTPKTSLTSLTLTSSDPTEDFLRTANSSLTVTVSGSDSSKYLPETSSTFDYLSSSGGSRETQKTSYSSRSSSLKSEQDKENLGPVLKKKKCN